LITDKLLVVQSPPKSQEEEDLVMTDVAPSQTTSQGAEMPAEKSSSSPATGSRSDTNGVQGKPVSDSGHGAPGSAWQNQKFHEDYDRAFKALQDQQWSMGKS
jgi:hypothetical protein